MKSLKEEIFKQANHVKGSGEDIMVDKAQVETALKVATQVSKGIVESKN